MNGQQQTTLKFLSCLSGSELKDFPARTKHLNRTTHPTDTLKFSSTALKPGVEIPMPGLPASLQGKVPMVTTSDLLARARFNMPVHACGYNWLDSNEEAAQRLAKRINEVIAHYGKRCKQVVIVTHSMGGLVTRRCAQPSGMKDKIAGVVHGVMPATGAAVAYRRCKLGMKEEGYAAGLVLGSNGREVTAVFAQAPGALQLLPSPEYGMGWLKVVDPQGGVRVREPSSDPYKDIYLRKDRWWGLIREEWLAPPEGMPITWDIYAKNIGYTRDFHDAIRNSYHPNTYVYYGVDPAHPSFETITWNMEPGNFSGGRMDVASVSQLGFDKVWDDGSNPVYAGREKSVQYTREGFAMENVKHHWNLRCAMHDGTGDGTVPASSGSAPIKGAAAGHVRVQARLPGFDHEPSYKNAGAQQFALYSLVKIASSA